MCSNHLVKTNGPGAGLISSKSMERQLEPLIALPVHLSISFLSIFEIERIEKAKATQLN